MIFTFKVYKTTFSVIYKFLLSVAYAKAKDKYEKAKEKTKALAQKAALYNKVVAD